MASPLQATADDLDDLALLRRLPAGARERLRQAVAGDGPGNVDRPLWIASRVLYALAHLSPGPHAPSVRNLIETVLAPAPGSADFVRRFGGRSVTAGGADLSADATGLHLALATGPFSTTWPQVLDALALVHFHFAADRAAQWAEMMAALDPLPDPALPARDALDEATRRLTRIGRLYVDAHFGLEAIRRRLARLITHLDTSRGRRRSDPAGDGEILAYWQAEIDADKRLLFSTAVRHVVALERVRAEERDRDALGGALSLDLPGTGTERPGLPSAGPGGRWDGQDQAGLMPEDLLARIPDPPNILKKTERAALHRLLGLHPLQNGRMRTVLRLLAFDPVQSAWTQRLRFGSTPVPEPEPYDAIRTTHERLRADIAELLVHAVHLRRRGPADPDDRLEPDEDEDDRPVPAGPERALPKVRALRRAGLPEDPDERAALFATFDAALAEIVAAFDGFFPPAGSRSRLPDAPGAFAADVPVFQAAFDRLYRS